MSIMTKANPRVEIYYRKKGNKRWLKTDRVYPLKKVDLAYADIQKSIEKSRGRYQYTLKQFVR